MRMKNLSVLLTLVVIVAPALAQDETPVVPDSLWAIGDRMMRMIAAGHVDSVVGALHYPPTYSDKQVASDVAALEDALKFLLAELGTFEGFEHFPGEDLCYEIGLSAGDVAYWESLSPLKTVELNYAVKFSKFGRSMVAVSLFETKSGMDLRAVVFCLDPSVPGARDKVIDIYVEIMRGQAKSAGQPLPKNLRELISASVPKLEPQKEESPDKPTD